MSGWVATVFFSLTLILWQDFPFVLLSHLQTGQAHPPFLHSEPKVHEESSQT